MKKIKNTCCYFRNEVVDDATAGSDIASNIEIAENNVEVIYSFWLRFLDRTLRSSHRINYLFRKVFWFLKRATSRVILNATHR